MYKMIYEESLRLYRFFFFPVKDIFIGHQIQLGKVVLTFRRRLILIHPPVALYMRAVIRSTQVSTTDHDSDSQGWSEFGGPYWISM